MGWDGVGWGPLETEFVDTSSVCLGPSREHGPEVSPFLFWHVSHMYIHTCMHVYIYIYIYYVCATRFSDLTLFELCFESRLSGLSLLAGRADFSPEQLRSN